MPSFNYYGSKSAGAQADTIFIFHDVQTCFDTDFQT